MQLLQLPLSLGTGDQARSKYSCLTFRALLPKSCSHSKLRRSRASGQLIRCDATQSLKPLVIVGSLNADSVLEVDRLPDPGETMSAKTMATFPGGKVAQFWLSVF